MSAHKYLIIAVMLAGCCCGISPARAVDEPEDVINYAYSGWIGSGFYKIGDRTVYLLRGPFSYTLREADSEKWGLALLKRTTKTSKGFTNSELPCVAKKNTLFLDYSTFAEEDWM